MTANAVPVALTCDDAPSITPPATSAGSAVRFDPGRMDRIRQTLQNAGIRDCTAFVVGAAARRHADALERWLAAGYQLANHTDDHVAASARTPRDFIESVRRCDDLLERVGAFSGGRSRFFRYPFGDRGERPRTRAQILEACHAMGYRIAHVSMDWYDHCYEVALTQAVARGDATCAARVEQRYLHVAMATTRRMAARAERIWPGITVHVATCHFGLVSERCLGALLRELDGQVAWRSLAEAAESPIYQAYDRQLEHNGIVADQVPRPLADRVGQRLARLSLGLGLFAQARYGPRWPHLAT